MSATVVAASVAGSSRAAEPYTNYDTFTPMPPRVSLKRKERSPSPAASVDSIGSNLSVYRGKTTLTLLANDSSATVSSDGQDSDGTRVGCWAAFKHWVSYLNPWF